MHAHPVQGLASLQTLDYNSSYHARTHSIRLRSVHLCIALAYRMASRNSRNPDEVTDVDNLEEDVSGMIAEVGAELVATEQAPTLRTRGQLRAARLSH